MRLEKLTACSLLKYAHLLEDGAGIRCNLCYFRTKDGKELDFVLSMDDPIAAAYEVKRSSTELSPGFRYFSPHLKEAVKVQFVAYPGGKEIRSLAEYLADLNLESVYDFERRFIYESIEQRYSGRQPGPGSRSKTDPQTTPVCRFALATNCYYKSEGVRQEDVSFFDVEVWSKVAESCEKHLKKGRGVRVVGRLKRSSVSDRAVTPVSTLIGNSCGSGMGKDFCLIRKIFYFTTNDMRITGVQKEEPE